MTSTQLRPTRRTLVRGAAWSVPAISIAAAAPAFAASPCDLRTYTLDWDGGNATTGTTAWARASYQSGKATVNAPTGSGSASIGVQFSSVWINESGGQARDRRDPAANLTISAETNVGGLNKGRGLYIRHESPLDSGRSRRQQITIAFDRPVTGLNFSMSDIDSSWGNYYDRVELSAVSSSGAAVAYTSTPVSTVTGAGTAANPFRQTSNDATYDPDRTGGNVGIAFTDAGAITTTGSVSSMTLVFWNSAGDGQQAVYLSDFTFKASGC